MASSVHKAKGRSTSCCTCSHRQRTWELHEPADEEARLQLQVALQHLRAHLQQHAAGERVSSDKEGRRRQRERANCRCVRGEMWGRGAEVWQQVSCDVVRQARRTLPDVSPAAKSFGKLLTTRLVDASRAATAGSRPASPGPGLLSSSPPEPPSPPPPVGPAPLLSPSLPAKVSASAAAPTAVLRPAAPN
jgi:hypothetical protein